MISIHALLAESDLAGPSGPAFLFNFYPRSPCGERRCLRCCAISCITISIHALLAESDINPANQTNLPGYFYPRSPCGERPPGTSVFRGWTLFLSTLSLRRATHHGRVNLFRFKHFYPRSPCGERREDANNGTNANLNFYPRSPCGERRSARPEIRQLCAISIHALLAESD